MIASDYAEAIIAWRVWLVVADGDEVSLSSVVHKTVWAPRCELEASCHRRALSLPRFGRRKPLQHSAPAEDCRCGIYGATDVARAASYLLTINPARCLPTNRWLDVAELLAVPERWVREHTRGGLIPHVRLGRYVRYWHDAVVGWIDEHERGGAAWRKHRPRVPRTSQSQDGNGKLPDSPRR